ncbi:MAG: beta-ketoacyl [acyl carrier protein] synthase domain-containing protein, partial [Planctomycetota bacterium]
MVGEGAGIFVLKRLEDARRDGDDIHGIIHAVGLSNDVQGSLLAPSSEGQLRAMRRAYEAAGWSPSDVDLIECHATGTPVGDAEELRSVAALRGPEAPPVVLGSVKSNVGHLLTGAGAAGLMKAILALRHGTLPPTANLSDPVDGAAVDEGPVRVLPHARPWRPRETGRARRAAVSAFGFGGINAHLLLEEDPLAVEGGDPKAVGNSIEVSDDATRVDVAIVGMAGRAGPWGNPGALRERLLGAGGDVGASPPAHWWGASESEWLREAVSGHAFPGHYLGDLAVP